MKNFVKKWLAGILVLSLAVGVCSISAQAAGTTTKNVIIAKISNDTLKYHKAGDSVNLFDSDWENIVGYGSQKQIKIAKNAKYYLLDGNDLTKLRKVSKKKFVNNLFEYHKSKENGFTYYTGMACKLTIKNGKCVKLEQIYQP